MIPSISKELGNRNYFVCLLLTAGHPKIYTKPLSAKYKWLTKLPECRHHALFNTLDFLLNAFTNTEDFRESCIVSSAEPSPWEKPEVPKGSRVWFHCRKCHFISFTWKTKKQNLPLAKAILQTAQTQPLPTLWSPEDPREEPFWQQNKTKSWAKINYSSTYTPQQNLFPLHLLYHQCPAWVWRPSAAHSTGTAFVPGCCPHCQGPNQRAVRLWSAPVAWFVLWGTARSV